MVRAGGWAAADAGALVPLIEGELDQLLHPLPHESVRQSSGLPPVSARAQVLRGMSHIVFLYVMCKTAGKSVCKIVRHSCTEDLSGGQLGPQQAHCTLHRYERSCCFLSAYLKCAFAHAAYLPIRHGDMRAGGGNSSIRAAGARALAAAAPTGCGGRVHSRARAHGERDGGRAQRRRVSGAGGAGARIGFLARVSGKCVWRRRCWCCIGFQARVPGAGAVRARIGFQEEGLCQQESEQQHSICWCVTS